VLARYTQQVDQGSHLEYAAPNAGLPTRARLANEVLITWLEYSHKETNIIPRCGRFYYREVVRAWFGEVLARARQPKLLTRDCMTRW
jgi:hypothetical protein